MRLGEWRYVPVATRVAQRRSSQMSSVCDLRTQPDGDAIRSGGLNEGNRPRDDSSSVGTQASAVAASPEAPCTRWHRAAASDLLRNAFATHCCRQRRLRPPTAGRVGGHARPVMLCRLGTDGPLLKPMRHAKQQEQRGPALTPVRSASLSTRVRLLMDDWR